MNGITDFLSGLFYGPFYGLAYSVWMWSMGVCTGIMGTTPEYFSPTAWAYVRDTLYPWAVGIGVSIMSLLFLIGIIKAVSNFKESITLELTVESAVRVVILNVLLQKGFELIRTFFQMTSLMSTDVMQMEEFNFYTTDADIGAHLFWWMFGMLYFLVSFVCSVMIVLTLYGRYIKLYLLTVFFPLAMPSLAGGRGIDASAAAWTKTFISNTFEIVVIALIMSIASMLIAGFSSIDTPILEYFDGGGQALNSIMSMVLMTSSVKGASAFLNKTFAL